MTKKCLWLILPLMLLALTSCASRPVSNPDDVCSIFKQKKHWYRAAKKSEKRWGEPIYVPMAIIYQESTFKRKARPKMRYFLGIFPRGRASNAYGYSQALEGTWGAYQKDIGSSSRSRTNFAHSIDFVQWYLHQSRTRNGVAKGDAYNHYLNYHEGHGGFSRGTHRSKQWLLNTARVVERRSQTYARQLSNCRL